MHIMRKKKKSMNLIEWKKLFIEHCDLVKNLSVHTISAYSRDIEAFIEFHQKHDPLLLTNNIESEHISAFLVDQYQNKKSAKSLARFRSSLRNLFNHIQIKNGSDLNPVELVNIPKVRQKLPEVLDVDTIYRLVDIPNESEIAIRDKACIELFYSSGLRLSELSHLYWSDIQREDSLIRVLGKGNKQRMVPIGKHALDALWQWRPYALLWDKQQSHHVFISQRGGRLKQRSIQARIKYWAQRQGLWERVYPHLLRHSFASHVLESSGNLRAVQEMLGHEDLSSTQIYTHLNFQHLAKVYDKAHPRARKKPDK